MITVYVLLIDGEIKNISTSKQTLQYYLRYEYKDRSNWDIQEFCLEG